MQSCTEGLIPFPYVDLFSLIDKSRDKNTNFSTCMHLAPYKASVYVGCSTTTYVHWDLCQKIKIKCWVSMSRHEISDPWPSIYWKRYDSSLQLHFEGYKSTILSYGKEEKAFNFEIKVTLEKLLHIESASLFSSSLNTVFSPQYFSLLLKRTSLSPFYELSFGGGPTRKYVMLSLMLIIY